MASLVITEGPASGEIFALEEHRLVMIGRDEKCTFQIVDTQISRRHLQIKFNPTDEKHYAIDFDSSNGVTVNGNKITAETSLNNDDVMRLGATAIVYSTEDAPDAKRIWERLRKHGEGRLTTMLPED